MNILAYRKKIKGLLAEGGISQVSATEFDQDANGLGSLSGY